jgi:hypothetical protein
MKTLFLCGSLEPGRDGVGDYVRRLATELIRQGFGVSAIALNDQYIKQEFSGEQLSESNTMLVLRLPAIWAPKRRFARAQQWAAEFQPEWISLQFVPYAFHNKGLPLLLSWQLHNLIRGRKVHIMMHEIWIGTGAASTLRAKLLARLQKIIVHNIISRLRPIVLHTHLPTYSTRLQALGHQVLPLPLFSNIPPVHVPLSSAADKTVFRIGIFSQADGSRYITRFLESLAENFSQHSQRCQVLLIGGRPTEMQLLKDQLNELTNFNGHVQYVGFLKPEQLSAALQTCQLGLTSVPRHGLGKSGSVAAFLAHGIPVAAPVLHPDYKAEDIGFFSDNLQSCVLLQPTIHSLRVAQASSNLAQHIIQISTVARTFLDDLGQA